MDSMPRLAPINQGIQKPVPLCIWEVKSENGRLSLFVAPIDDRTVVEANRDGLIGREDVEIVVGAADLLANDSLDGQSGSNLSITAVGDFRHGTGYLDANGSAHFTPEANYAGSEAGFDYTVRVAIRQAGVPTANSALRTVNARGQRDATNDSCWRNFA